MTDTEMILQAISGINSRLDKVDARLDKMDEKLDNMGERIEILEEQNEKLTAVSNVTLDVLKEIADELVGQGLYHPSEKTKKAI
mgnify:CR=1 FL=1